MAAYKADRISQQQTENDSPRNDCPDLSPSRVAAVVESRGGAVAVGLGL
jgi:hypothetical protein